MSSRNLQSQGKLPIFQEGSKRDWRLGGNFQGASLFRAIIHSPAKFTTFFVRFFPGGTVIHEFTLAHGMKMEGFPSHRVSLNPSFPCTRESRFVPRIPAFAGMTDPCGPLRAEHTDRQMLPASPLPTIPDLLSPGIPNASVGVSTQPATGESGTGLPDWN